MRRRVALKLIKPGFDSGSILARFEQERQALAMMDHPNIARVFDAGATETGQPYFVMELVQGVPLTDFCDQARLTPRERLDLFLPVCEAVQHAHRKGVIHRDLKPSNIIVGNYDGRPIPKVIDFGIAKAATGPLTERTLFTEIGSVIGTPEYMAPEQAELNDLDIDTRSDVYSLGAVLYELLAGSLPFTSEQLRGAAFLEMLRMIREAEPPKPSARLANSEKLPAIAALRRIEPARLTSLIRGELDWIVMKCLEKQPSRRYESPLDLARDIRRHLADEPVLAGPPSRSYLLLKTLRRHRRGLAIAAAFAVLITAGAVAAFVLAVRAMRAETIAEEKGQVAQSSYGLARQAIRGYVAALSRAPEFEQADLLPLRKQLLETAAPFFEELSRIQPASLEQAIERARALDELAGVQGSLGEGEAALRNVEASEQQVRELLRAHPGNLAVETLLGDVLNRRGWVLEALGRLDDSMEAHGEALAVHERIALRRPDDLELLGAVAMDRYNLAVAAQHRGDLDRADAYFRDAAAAYQRIADGDRSAPRRLVDVITCHLGRGQVFASRREWQGAEKEVRRAEELTAEVIGKPPEAADVKSLQATVRRDLGTILWRTDRYAEAEREFLGLIDLREGLHRQFPSRVSYASDLADGHIVLGGLLVDLGRLDEADAQLARATSAYDDMEAQFPKLPWPRFAGAVARQNRGVALLNRARPQEAEPLFREASARLERAARGSEASADTVTVHGTVLSLLGEALRAQGKSGDALAAHGEAVAILKAHAASHPGVAEIEVALLTALKNQVVALVSPLPGARETTIQLCREAEQAGEKLASSDTATIDTRRDYATILDEVSRAHRHWREWDAARERLERSVGLRESILREAPARGYQFGIELARTCLMLGTLERDRGELSRAIEWNSKAIGLVEPLLATHPDDPFCRHSLERGWQGSGFIQLQLGRFEDSSRSWDKAGGYADAEKPKHALGQAIAAALAAGRAEEAMAACDRALALDLRDIGLLYDMGCIVSIAASRLPDGEAARGQLCERAIAFLRAVVRLGFRDAAFLKSDPDLATLREHPAFGSLLGELMIPEPPAAPATP